MSKTQINVRFPLLGVLTIVFVVLKLCKVITWSWWWVLCPLWIPISVILIIALIAGSLGIVSYLITNKDK